MQANAPVPAAEEPEAEPAENTPASPTSDLEAGTRITAQKSSNQLLVRTRPAQWKEIEAAIKRLDNPPLQVQIETRILEVKLTGELDLGVQWYLGRLAGNSTSTTVANASGSQGALGGGGAGLGRRTRCSIPSSAPTCKWPCMPWKPTGAPRCCRRHRWW